MKPNLLIQITLVVLSLILLLVAVLLPTKSREVPTTISMELNGERVVLSTSARDRSRPQPEAEATPDKATTPEGPVNEDAENTPTPAPTNASPAATGGPSETNLK